MMKPQDLLQKYFRYAHFRGPQEDIIRHVLHRRHALVIMPTGMGKSLCYQIPALAQQGLTHRDFAADRFDERSSR